MKFLSSSSSSASSTTTTTTTTTTTFDGNLCNSKTTPSGCLAGVFRRLLCFNSLPTFTCDHQIRDTDLNSVEFEKLRNLETEEKIEPREAPSPSIVARLMGLESMPQIDFVNTQMGLSSISRSRSMNYVESRREFESKQGRHRRVKSSLSSREAPTFLELDQENFFVLSFENLGETKLSSKAKKRIDEFGELKPKKAEHCRNKNKENQEPNRKINQRHSQKVGNNGKVRNSSDVLRPTEICNGRSHVSMDDAKNSKSITHKEMKKKKKENCSVAKKVETECDSENSSPVSVLDFGEFITDPKLSTSGEESRFTGSNSRRKLSTELENYENPSASKANNPTNDDQERNTNTFEGKINGLKKKVYQNQDYADIWSEICKMAEEEVTVSNCRYRDTRKHEDISSDLGHHIFEELLSEFVDQLAGNSHERSFDL